MNQLTVSLWGDEAWAATLINKGWIDIVKFVSKDTSPPAYYLLAHAWTRIFGMSEVGLRSLSTALFIGTAIFASLIAWELFKNKKTAFITLMLALVNPFLFQYAFEARMYAALVFGSTMATYFYVKKWWLPYILAAGFSLYTHHFSIFIIFWHFAWTFINWLPKRKDLVKTFWPFVGVGLVYLPWLPTMYFQTKMVSGGFWLGKPVPQDLLGLFFKFLSGTTTHPLQTAAVIFGAITLILRKWSLKHKEDFFLIGWLVVPVLITYAMSQVVTPIFYDRYMLNTIPALVLLLSSHWRKLYGEAIIILTALAMLVLDWNFFIHPTKRPFRELASFVQATRKPGDALVNWNGNAHHLFESKYYNVYAPIYTPNGPLPYYTGTALMEPGDQIPKLPDAPRIGVMTSESPDKVSLPGYTKVDQKQFGDLVMEWWTKNKVNEKKNKTNQR